jgi:hypothetical protein
MPTEQMRMEVVEITPELAESLLLTTEAVPHRTRTARRVAGFAGAMARGQWQITHQPIAIDPAGTLIDGQHRLSAVVAAGIPVSMLVAYNVPRETFAVIDAGQARSTSQALYIAGHVDVNITAAAVRAVMMYDQIKGTRRLPTGDLRAQVTTPDVLDYLDSDRGAIIRTAIAPARMIAVNVSRTGIRSWLTAAIAIVYEATPDDPDLGLRLAFIDALHTGAMLPPGSPILRFRRWLISDNGYDNVNRNYRQQVGIAALIQTWNAWTQGRENLRQIRMMPGRDLWPVVGEKPDDIAARDAEREQLFADDALALDAESAALADLRG